MITSLGSDHQGTATLTINDFMTERKFFEDLPEVSVQVEDLIGRTIVDSMPQEMVTKRGGSYEQKNLLTVDALSIPFENAGQFTISNIGFVDGQLHIQVKTILGGDELNAGYYISAQFGDEQNKRLYEPTAVFDFIADKKYAYSEAAKEPHANYTELIYSDINSVEQLEGMSMFIDYMQPPQISKGTWTFSFNVPEKVSQVLAVNRELSINGEDMYIEAIAISPLGITLTLPKNISGEYEHMDHLRYRN